MKPSLNPTLFFALSALCLSGSQAALVASASNIGKPEPLSLASMLTLIHDGILSKDVKQQTDALARVLETHQARLESTETNLKSTRQNITDLDACCLELNKEYHTSAKTGAAHQESQVRDEKREWMQKFESDRDEIQNLQKEIDSIHDHIQGIYESHLQALKNDSLIQEDPGSLQRELAHAREKKLKIQKKLEEALQEEYRVVTALSANNFDFQSHDWVWDRTVEAVAAARSKLKNIDQEIDELNRKTQNLHQKIY